MIQPGTHIVGSWVIGSISLYRDPRTGTQYIGNWASWDSRILGFLRLGSRLWASQPQGREFGAATFRSARCGLQCYYSSS